MLFKIEVIIKIEPVEADEHRYRYLFSLPKDVATNPSTANAILDSNNRSIRTKTQRYNSTNVADISMNSMTFCKAFPWHFIMNEDLKLVQLGKYNNYFGEVKSYVIVPSSSCCFNTGRGFIKLFKSSLADGNRDATTYFNFKRPRGMNLNFRDIVRRTYTPFLISLKNPLKETDFIAKVRDSDSNSNSFAYAIRLYLYIIYRVLK